MVTPLKNARNAKKKKIKFVLEKQAFHFLLVTQLCSMGYHGVGLTNL